jgi:hypothetical protein
VSSSPVDANSLPASTVKKTLAGLSTAHANADPPAPDQRTAKATKKVNNRKRIGMLLA